MKIFQQQLRLKQRNKGFHLITGEIVNSIPQLEEIQTGVCQIFIQHTSASLSINEDADPSVRRDFESFFNGLVPESESRYEHNTEGIDDMPAHLKSSLLGTSLAIPIHNGELALGRWQGIYLCEHRDQAKARNLIVTLFGE
jgi:secondary thiamine-phosphate synthase enzyme